MLPSMGPESQKRLKTKPHLVIRIKKGWHYNDEKKQFVSSENYCLAPKDDLPAQSYIEYRVPQLAKASKDSLSSDEIDLLHYFNLMLPSGSDPSDYLKIVKKWPCVEEVQLPPAVGLPTETPMIHFNQGGKS